MSLYFNVDPYYDDFDQTKNFHRILFKPGKAVQARELTQSQTILQDQITKFADNIFKQNSPVTGGQVTTNLNCYYIKLTNPAGFDVTQFFPNNNGVFIQNATGTITAKVLTVAAATGTGGTGDPPTLIVTYISGQQFTDAMTIYEDGSVTLGGLPQSGIGNISCNNINLKFQKITTADSITINFTNWPTSTGSGALGYGVMRVWVVITDVAHTMTLPDSVNIEVGDIAGYDIATKTITFDAAGNYIFDFSSIDGGNDYMIFDVTRNRASFRDHQLYYNPDVSPTMYVGFGEGLSTAQAIGGGLDAIAADGSLSSVGITTTANLAYTVPTGGYSVVAMRGNIEADTVSPVASNDYLGYFDAYAFTGNGTSNTFAKTASISMFVTGSNVVTGLGGNVAIFTKPAGTGNISTGSTQVVGFENDQLENLVLSYYLFHSNQIVLVSHLHLIQWQIQICF